MIGYWASHEITICTCMFPAQHLKVCAGERSTRAPHVRRVPLPTLHGHSRFGLCVLNLTLILILILIFIAIFILVWPSVIGSTCNAMKASTAAVSRRSIVLFLAFTQKSVRMKHCLPLGCRAIKEVLCAPPSRGGLTRPLAKLRACIREAVETRWVPFSSKHVRSTKH